MALLFSSNALRIVRADAPQMPLPVGAALSAVQGAKRLALVHVPLEADEVRTWVCAEVVRDRHDAVAIENPIGRRRRARGV